MNLFPVSDYTSLYPSSMISDNLSHDTIAEDKKWQGEYKVNYYQKNKGTKLSMLIMIFMNINVCGNRKNPEKELIQVKNKFARFVQPKKDPKLVKCRR